LSACETKGAQQQQRVHIFIFFNSLELWCII